MQAVANAPDTFVSTRSFAGSLLNILGTTNQNGKILLHLLRAGTITQLEAHELYRVYRLASRIADLKKQGVTIKATPKIDFTGTRYTEYSLQ